MKHCPACGERGECKQTRQRRDNTYRNYKCNACAQTWTTVELLDRRLKPRLGTRTHLDAQNEHFALLRAALAPRRDVDADSARG